MKLALAGDVMLGRLVNEALKAWPPASPWGDTIRVFQAADWAFCNLECVVSDLVPADLPGKAFHFRSDRKNVAALQVAGIDAVSVANNHCLDFGCEAMLDMLDALDGAGIGHAGAGADLDAARRPARARVRDVRLAVFACTDNEPGWAAGEGRPGVWFVPADAGDERARDLVRRVAELAAAGDLVVVSLHWGGNWGRDPEPGHRDLARALVAAGARVVFGHSCHVLRGIEAGSGAVTVYGAGDFIDDYAVDEVERNDQSLILELDVDAGRVVMGTLRPAVIRDRRAVRARGDEARAILERVRTLSHPLDTDITITQGRGLLDLRRR